jgi:MGT family glycosyltransferase
MAADVVLHATDREFDLDFDRLPLNHHYVGPLLWDPPAEAPAYMEEDGPPWILASLSTIPSPDETSLLRTMLDAVSGVPARVLITAPDHGSEATGNVPDNVRLERFVPHGPALRKSALMLSHAGHGAVIKALWYGVPMVLAPWDRDQPGVAHRAARLGAAIVVARSDLTAERLRAALLQGLSDPAVHAAAARHGARLRATDPTATACRILEDIPERRLRLASSP